MESRKTEGQPSVYECMVDVKLPVLTKFSMTLRHATSDYSVTGTFAKRLKTDPPHEVMLCAFEELTRLTSMYGYAEEARNLFENMQKAVAEEMAEINAMELQK